jgi:dihydrodipicolinate synthase/N-acetylneuraminate lyase
MSRNCCAALYIKVAYTVGTVYNNFVIAKSGINPSLLPRIIPNLERMSVKKAVQLAHYVNPLLKILIRETFIWTESKMALQWLATLEGNLQVLPRNYYAG